MTGFIGYENILESGTLSASSEDASYPKENAIDWLTTDWWAPSAGGTYYLTVDYGSIVSADYVGIAGHTLGTQSAQVNVQYSSDNFSADVNDAYTLEAVSSDSIYIKKFTQQSARYWRLKIVSTNPAYIGQVSIGTRMDIDTNPEPGFSPPQYSQTNRVLNHTTDGGKFLGRTKFSTGASFSIPVRYVSAANVRSEFEAFQTHAIIKPFFYAWDYDNYPTEAAYCWTNGDIKVSYQSTTLMESTISVTGEI